MNIQAVFEKFKDIKVAVLGDVMLDTYFWGEVERISPEAPVPIVLVKKEEYRLGGAANVAFNLAALGAQAYVFSVVGQDSNADSLFRIMADKQIEHGHILQTATRPTTSKTRIMARNQQVMRLDNEVLEDLSAELETRLLNNLEAFFKAQRPELLILEDYNKGVLTPNVIGKAIQLANEYNVLTAVDPKQQNFFLYQNVTIFKPNLKEIKAALSINNLITIDLESLAAMHAQLFSRLNHEYSLFTLSEKGVFYQQTDRPPNLLPAKIRNIADVSGAGDTVIAVISLVYAITGDMSLAAEMGNIAGGLVCEQVGTVAINKEKLLTETINCL